MSIIRLALHVLKQINFNCTYPVNPTIIMVNTDALFFITTKQISYLSVATQLCASYFVDIELHYLHA